MSVPVAVRVQHLLPQRLLCKFIYAVSRCRVRWFKSTLIAWFARQYAINLDEAREPDLSKYPSFNAFFTRALRDGARIIDPQPGAVVSPADGRLTRFGPIEDGRIIQAKGFDYALHELLGESAADTEPFNGGVTATIYLAPHNYHRVHAPAAGRLSRMRYIAGKRFSVNATTASWISRLYCQNERLVCWFDSAFGPYAAVLVGALNVSSISTTLTGEIRSGRDAAWTDFRDNSFACGQEFGRFNLGSTVVMAFPRDSTALLSSLQSNQDVLVGQRIATALRTTDQS
jgi:phosphatidylserine decarboxylase